MARALRTLRAAHEFGAGQPRGAVSARMIELRFTAAGTPPASRAECLLTPGASRTGVGAG